ncbi:hypothetical protein FBZ89_12264 [Nitrospirillum amazonense]|uniref:Uncharacterized protein n=1 Tax=Nitrospirillum amazonense TaxID=28077 RepID=A0A560EUA5_9PROT|nr:hypothetical protein FBZ89_12264 [Nitrospirillum amazonense]
MIGMVFPGKVGLASLVALGALSTAPTLAAAPSRRDYGVRAGRRPSQRGLVHEQGQSPC